MLFDRPPLKVFNKLKPGAWRLIFSIPAFIDRLYLLIGFGYWLLAVYTYHFSCGLYVGIGYYRFIRIVWGLYRAV